MPLSTPPDSATPFAVLLATISGTSLLPVMVMVTTCVSVLSTVALELSVAVSVYSSTRVCPSGRKSKGELSVLPALNCQVKSEPAVAFAASASPATTCIIARRVALSGGVPVNVLAPATATDVTSTVTVSLVSVSTTFSVPEALRDWSLVPSSTTSVSSAATAAPEITGASFVPSMVTVTLWVKLRPPPVSVTVTSYSCTMLSPAANASTIAIWVVCVPAGNGAPMVKLQPTVPSPSP